MTGNQSHYRYVFTQVLTSLALIALLWALIHGSGSKVELLQPSSDTRIYIAETPDGLSLALDLKVPQAPRLPTPLVQGANADHLQPQANNEPDEQPSRWPSYLLAILLAGSAVWYLRKQQSPTPPAHATFYSRDKDALSFESGSVFFLGEHQETETVSTEEEFEVSINLLRKHIDENPGESTVPWLLLLDLLHRKGNAQEYEETRKQCKRHFNVDMPPYNKIKTGPQKQGVESYPHIMNKLIQLWSGEEAYSYLNALLHDSRDGSRAGFDLTTYHDIALLCAILETKATLQSS